MKLTILGNNGPYPSAGGACSGYLLCSDTTRVLIDCGSGTLANLPRHIAWAELDAVIYSHEIGDTITVILYRNGQEQTITLTVTEYVG